MSLDIQAPESSTAATPAGVKALVTGGGGFIGGAIVRQLLERGNSVRSFSRRAHAISEELGVEQQQGDVANAEAVDTAVSGCQLVFHVAAKAGSWGPRSEYLESNLVGTENVIRSCLNHSVRYLIFTSSPSVVFDGNDMEGVDESQPYPSHYEAPYPETKALAEQAVLAANSDTLRTVAIRPHLVWGPGDTNLVPRILAQGRAKQLRRIGRANKLVDVTFIDDAARAHLLAADRLQSAAGGADDPAGKAYFVSSGKPIPTWTMVNRILAAANLPPVTRTVPTGAAWLAGWLLETGHRLAGSDREPRLTRWVARELSTAHWFDISAARRDLGYQPTVDLEDGMERLRAWLQETSSSA